MSRFQFFALQGVKVGMCTRLWSRVGVITHAPFRASCLFWFLLKSSVNEMWAGLVTATVSLMQAGTCFSVPVHNNLSGGAATRCFNLDVMSWHVLIKESSLPVYIRMDFFEQSYWLLHKIAPLYFELCTCTLIYYAQSCPVLNLVASGEFQDSPGYQFV